jgi:hypothetical protein
MVRFQFSWTLLLAIVLGFVFYASVGRRSLAQIPPQTPPVKEPSMIHAVAGASLFQSYCVSIILRDMPWQGCIRRRARRGCSKKVGSRFNADSPAAWRGLPFT